MRKKSEIFLNLQAAFMSAGIVFFILHLINKRYPAFAGIAGAISALFCSLYYRAKHQEERSE